MEKLRENSTLVNFNQLLLPCLTAKKIIFSFIGAIFKIQKLCRDIILSKVTQKNLIIELWKIRIAELYTSTNRKGKRNLINVKKIMNITDQQRNNTIGDFLQEERKEFKIRLKAWRNKLKQIENE